VRPQKLPAGIKEGLRRGVHFDDRADWDCPAGGGSAEIRVRLDMDFQRFDTQGLPRACFDDLEGALEGLGEFTDGDVKRLEPEVNGDDGLEIYLADDIDRVLQGLKKAGATSQDMLLRGLGQIAKSRGQTSAAKGIEEYRKLNEKLSGCVDARGYVDAQVLIDNPRYGVMPDEFQGTGLFRLKVAEEQTEHKVNGWWGGEWVSPPPRRASRRSRRSRPSAHDDDESSDDYGESWQHSYECQRRFAMFVMEKPEEKRWACCRIAVAIDVDLQVNCINPRTRQMEM
jgi:hypothetical protein